MATKATGPLGNLTEENTSYLIELFQSHQELWDPRRPKYRNKQLKAGLWLSLKISFSSTTGIDCTVGHIQAKIASLRNTFSREMRKINKSKVSGAGACDVYNTSWPFFQQLKFLLPVMSLMVPTSSNLEAQGMNQQELSGEDPSYQFQTEEEISEINSEGAKEDDPVLSPVSSPCVSRSDSTDAGIRPAKKARKDQGDELAEYVLDYYKSKNKPKEDPELIWAKTLIRNISKIPDIRKRQLIQLDIEDLVSKALRQHLEKND